jgi:hypothetical protein
VRLDRSRDRDSVNRRIAHDLIEVYGGLHGWVAELYFAESLRIEVADDRDVGTFNGGKVAN